MIASLLLKLGMSPLRWLISIERLSSRVSEVPPKKEEMRIVKVAAEEESTGMTYMTAGVPSLAMAW